MFKFISRLNSCFNRYTLFEVHVARYFNDGANLTGKPPFRVLIARYFNDGANLTGKPPFSQRSQIIDGKFISQRILEKLKFDVNKWIGLGNRRPHLTVILIGDDPASKLYVNNKAKAAKYCGITSDVVHCPTTYSQGELLNLISDLNADDTVDAILVQLPCPDHINEKVVFDSISICKDVDGFNVFNLANLTLRQNEGIVPCTALAVSEILQELRVPSKGLEAVLVGCSKYIGLPIFLTLCSPSSSDAKKGFNFTTTVCQEFTPLSVLEDHIRRSDIVVSAVGKPNIINGNLIKPGAIVIDVGTSVINGPSSKQKKIQGDVEFDNALKNASHITPVPGGVGPVTVAMLMKNTLLCAMLCKRRRLELEQANTMTED